MKVGLAFVSEQIFNNLFRGGVRSDESVFPLVHLLHLTSISWSLYFLQILFG